MYLKWCVILSPPLREEIHVFLLFSSKNVYPTCIYLLLTPKFEELWLIIMLGLIQKFRQSWALPHSHIRIQSYDWWLYNKCSQMNSIKFFPTEYANKYWFLSYWYTQVLQFIFGKGSTLILWSSVPRSYFCPWFTHTDLILNSINDL